VKLAFYSMAGALIVSGIYLIVISKPLWGTVNSVMSDMSVGLGSAVALFTVATVLIILVNKGKEEKSNNETTQP